MSAQESMRSGRQAKENKENKKLDNAERSAYSCGMTIDERIEKLTERQEALTQTVELLASFVRDTQQMIVSVARDLQEVVRIVRDHEHRIHDLENQN